MIPEMLPEQSKAINGIRQAEWILLSSMIPRAPISRYWK